MNHLVKLVIINSKLNVFQKNQRFKSYVKKYNYLNKISDKFILSTKQIILLQVNHLVKLVYINKQ